jgi:hypothetical protein
MFIGQTLRSGSRLTLFSVALSATLAACGEGSGSPRGEAAADPPGEAARPLAPAGAAPALPDPGDAVMGFESASAWKASGASVFATAVRTQGSSALALRHAREEAELASDPVSSGAAALAGLGDAGSAMALDVLVPARDGREGDDDGRGGREHRGGGGDHRGDGDHHGGGDHRGRGHGDDKARRDRDRDGEGAASLQLLVSSRSLKLHRVSLGHADLRKARPGIYSTVRFAIPGEVRNKLAGATFDDLVFHIRLRAPGKAHESFAFDNLRVRSPGSPLPGSGRSADLLAILSYAPASSTPGEATFPVGLVQIPESLHVKRGSAGRGHARLQLGFGTSVFTACTFRATHDGTGYRLRGCSGGPRAGDLVAADHARLELADGDPGAGPTKVLAQLAVNPVGDTAGAGIIPPMPTFWGATPDEATAIAIAYFDLVNQGPKREERFIAAPVPDFALRHGDGRPHDNLTGPPPPSDPPFDQEGHLNQGGNWDGYWRLAGSLVADNTANRAKTHFDADLSAHGVAWGNDVEVASVQTTIDTDYGQLDNGLQGSKASGELHLFLFGSEVAGGPFSSGQNFTIDVGDTAAFDLPPVDIWIFTVTLGMRAGVSAKGSGGISPAGFTLVLTPKASVGVHVEGGVSVVVASGTVSADVDLLAVDVPLNAMAGWLVNTDPSVCAASLSFNLGGDLHLTSLGGKVDLNATFGICPFCDHEKYTIYSWDGLDLGTVPLFHVSASAQIFPLPQLLCLQPLLVSIESPTSGAQLVAGVPFAVAGRAAPTPTPTNPAPADIDCSGLSWSTDDPADVFLPAPTGCHPVLVLDGGRLGARTISLHAADAFGETGDAAPVSIQVLGQSGGLQAIITAPADGFSTLLDSNHPVRFSGGASGASPAATLTWTATPKPPPAGPGGPPIPMGTGPFVDFMGTGPGEWTITLMVQDGASSASTSIEVFFTTLT